MMLRSKFSSFFHHCAGSVSSNQNLRISWYMFWSSARSETIGCITSYRCQPGHIPVQFAFVSIVPRGCGAVYRTYRLLKKLEVLPSLPLQGEGQDGDGYSFATLNPNPHPNPPLEGEGTYYYWA